MTNFQRNTVILVSVLSTLWELQHWLTYSLWISRALFWVWQWELLIMRLNFTRWFKKAEVQHCLLHYDLPHSRLTRTGRPRGKAASISLLFLALIQSRKANFALFALFFSFLTLALLRQRRYIEISCCLLATCKPFLMVFADVDSVCSELHIFPEPQWSQEAVHKWGSALCRDFCHHWVRDTAWSRDYWLHRRYCIQIYFGNTTKPWEKKKNCFQLRRGNC